MSTTTRSHTTTITAGDVRHVMAQVSEEMDAICRTLDRVARDFDGDAAQRDISILVLNDCVATIRVQIYRNGVLVREYRFVIADRPLEAWGPPPGQPPLGPVPDDARVRLVVTPNPHQPAEYVEGWFDRLGWEVAEPLEMPQGQDAQAYGSFVSGGFGMERRLLSNPRFDRPLNQPSGQFRRKGR